MSDGLWHRFTRLFRSASGPAVPGLLLSGGGARSAYQAGVIRYIAEAFPEAYFPIQTGVSAGAINASVLGTQTGTFEDSAKHLLDSWAGLELDQIVEVESELSMLWGLLWDPSQVDESPPSSAEVRSTHGLLDTTPLWAYLRDRLEAPDGDLTGVTQNVADGRLQALAVVTTNYATGQTVTWVQGNNFDEWERSDRIGKHTQLTVDHVMASTAIPLVFPAVRLGDAWYGDGGIRLAAPLAPAIHLGADKILAISTRYARSREEADEPVIHGYPPTAQIIGVLMNSIFLDALDQDAHQLHRINRLLDKLPFWRTPRSLRRVEMLCIRPSVDLGRLAHDYEDHIPGSVRLLTTGLGTAETESPDWLSVLLFDPGYIETLLEIGYADARSAHDRIEAFLADTPAAEPDPPGLRRCAAGDASGEEETL